MEKGLQEDIKTKSDRRSYFHGTVAAFQAITFGVSITVMGCISWIKEYCNIVGEEKVSNFTMFNRCVPVTSSQWTYIMSILCLGAFISSLGIAFIKNLNLNQKMIISNVLYILGTIFIVTMSNFYFLLFGRLIIGVAIGFTCSTVPVYLNRIAPKGKVGFFGFMYGLGIVSGILFGYILSYFLSALYMWQYAFSGFLAYILLHLAFLATIKRAKTNVCEFNRKESTIKDLFTDKSVRKVLFLALLLQLIQQLSGINGILFYTEKLLAGNENAKELCIFLSAMAVLATFAVLLIVDKFKREDLLILSTVISTVGLLCLFFEAHPIVSLAIYAIGFNIGLGPMVSTLSTELLPDKYKSIGANVTSSFCWLLSAIVTYIFPAIFDSIGGMIFVLCGVATVITTAIFSFYYKNMKPTDEASDAQESENALNDNLS